MARKSKIIRMIMLCSLAAGFASGAFGWGARNAGNGNHIASYHRGNSGYGYGFHGNHSSGFYPGSYGWYDPGCRFWPAGAVDFNVVDPPVGSIFGYLPDGGTMIVVDGIGYYYYNGYYLRQSPAGYMVVSPPYVAPPAAPIAATQPRAQNTQSADQRAEPADYPIAVGKSITINIPNSKGGFTPVKLVKFKDGFIGPQNEFYSNHPTIEELRVLYGN